MAALVLSSVMVPGIGVNLLRVSAAAEETGEESKSEVEFRELSHKCSRAGYYSPVSELVSPSRPIADESMTQPPEASERTFSAFLQGAGICRRC